MQKLLFYLSLIVVFIRCSNNTKSTTTENVQTPKQSTPAPITITKTEMILSAYAHGTDNYSEIYVYIDFEKDSSYCHRSFYNPAFANKAYTYTLSHHQIQTVLALLKIVDLQETNRYYEKQEAHQPTAKTIIYTTQNKFTINDYGLIANKPLPQIYNIVYKFQ